MEINNIKLFEPHIIPNASEADNVYSDDVFVINEDGLHGIAFYDFEGEKWGFHTSTLVDYNEVGYEMKWWWYYPPIELKDIQSATETNP